MKVVCTKDVLVGVLFTFSVGMFIGQNWAHYQWGNNWVNEEVNRLIKLDAVLALLENQSVDEAKRLQTDYMRQALEQVSRETDLPDSIQAIVDRRKPLLTP